MKNVKPIVENEATAQERQLIFLLKTAPPNFTKRKSAIK
jgi:hypothetical protein